MEDGRAEQPGPAGAANSSKDDSRTGWVATSSQARTTAHDNLHLHGPWAGAEEACMWHFTCTLPGERGVQPLCQETGKNEIKNSYKIFQHNPNDSSSIGSNFIRCLYEFDNTLWVGTDTGLFKYHEQTESFSLLNIFVMKTSCVDNYCLCVCFFPFCLVAGS